MTDQDLSAIRKMFVMYVAYYRQPQLPDEVIHMYASDLSDLPLNAIQAAFEKYRKDPKNKTCPMPSQIRSLIQPEIDPEIEAREAASRIQAAVTKFGWCNPNEARAYIGEAGWHAVLRWGGWVHLCQNLGVSIDVANFQAQAREVLKGEMKRRQLGIADMPPLLSSGPAKVKELVNHVLEVQSKKLLGVGK